MEPASFAGGLLKNTPSTSLDKPITAATVARDQPSVSHDESAPAFELVPVFTSFYKSHWGIFVQTEGQLRIPL